MSGAYSNQATDLAVPGRGLGFTFTRTYNSALTTGGPLGPGWRHSYQMSLALNPDESITFNAEDGAAIPFLSDGAGGFYPANGVLSTLAAVPGGYTVVDRAQLTRVFDSTGRLTSEHDRNNNTVTFGYTGSDLTSIADTVGRSSTLSYDASHRLIQLKRPAQPGGRLRLRRQRPPIDRDRCEKRAVAVRLRRIGEAGHDRRPQQRNVTQVTNLNDTRRYAYDTLDRLTNETCSPLPHKSCTVPFVNYTYDPVDNRLTEGRSSGTTSYTYDAADRLLSAGSTSYTWDANGNQLSVGPRSFVWDLANRLKTTTSGSTTNTYAYDGQGRRVTAAQGTTTTRFVWDTAAPVALLAEEKNASSGVLLRHYGYGPAGVTSMYTGGAAYYYVVDRLGSIINTTSSNGGVQSTYDYEPYGGTRSETNKNGAPTNLLRFTGQYLDTATGLYHLRARQYDPATGRFLARDPLGPTMGEPCVSPYGYARANPLRYVDPSGRESQSPGTGRVRLECYEGGLEAFPVLVSAGTLTARAGFGLLGFAAGTEVVTAGLGTPISALEAGLGVYLVLLGTGEVILGGFLLAETCG